jgi:hypothetical protein
LVVTDGHPTVAWHTPFKVGEPGRVTLFRRT